MGHEHPLPYDYLNGGHKTWLTEQAGSNGGPTVLALAHSALYLGEVLEHVVFELQRQGATLDSPPWYPENPHTDDV
jgi:hypothetical protein